MWVICFVVQNKLGRLFMLMKVKNVPEIKIIFEHFLRKVVKFRSRKTLKSHGKGWDRLPDLLIKTFELFWLTWLAAWLAGAGIVQDGGDSHPGFLDAFRALFAACRGYTTDTSLQQFTVFS